MQAHQTLYIQPVLQELQLHQCMASNNLAVENLATSITARANCSFTTSCSQYFFLLHVYVKNAVAVHGAIKTTKYVKITAQ